MDKKSMIKSCELSSWTPQSIVNWSKILSKLAEPPGEKRYALA